MWVYGFRFSFTPLAGVLFAFPSRYFCSIGRISYLALDRGRPGFRQDFSCPAVLRYRPRSLHNFAYGDFTLSVRLSQNLSATVEFSRNSAPCGQTALQPRPNGRFRLFRFRSPLLPKSFLFSFPGVLRWFSSPSFASITYLFNYGWQDRSCRVTPFGYQRINGCVLLPVAFRSLPRPSSPQYAKASTVNPIFT